MKFCRNCGTVLAASSPGLPPTPMMGGPGAPMGIPPGPMGPPGYGAPGTFPGPGGVPPAPPQGYGAPPGGPPIPHPASVGTTTCPRCGSPTPAGFAFCQQCGFKLPGPPGQGAIDAHGATMAAPGGMPQPGLPQPAVARPPSQPGAVTTPDPVPSHLASTSWGTAVSVNRDGSDGERFPFASDVVVIGRAGADIAFDQDRFLARQHARIEAGPEGARVVPVDAMNGVFRKIDGPVELRDGSVILVGREVLRFEAIDGDERSPQPLVQHGVALFGSPPREPWGRLMQLLPSGGYRDVRHLFDEEIILGREEGDLVFSDDAFLSRRHAAIAWDGRRAVLTDLGSSNGTFIRLLGPYPIKHGEHLRMGDQLFRVELRGR